MSDGMRAMAEVAVRFAADNKSLADGTPADQEDGIGMWVPRFARAYLDERAKREQAERALRTAEYQASWQSRAESAEAALAVAVKALERGACRSCCSECSGSISGARAALTRRIIWPATLRVLTALRAFREQSMLRAMPR